MPLHLPRREFLKGVGATAAAGIASGCRQRDLSTYAPVETVVAVMMENRSFDHYLGALLLEEGRSDVDGLASEMSNPDYQDTEIPVHRADLWCVGDPPHGWDTSRKQFSGGTNQGFVQAYIDRHGTAQPHVPMGFFNRADLPVTYALSDAYTVCDRWFCSLMSSTWPNRLYSISATTHGVRGNEFPPGEAGYTDKTIFEQLDDAGVSWAYYFSNIPFAILYSNLRGREEVRRIDDFFDDCRDGTLPQVVWIDPEFGINDDHPPLHPHLGQLFLATIHNALAASPQWNRSLMVAYYDEHGGFFDHVPPPTVPDDRADQGFDQLGFRSPTVVAGPWVKPGACVSTPYDHTSLLATIQGLHGLPPLTTRDASANDLLDVLDLSRIAAGRPLAPARLPVLEVSEEQIDLDCRGSRFRTGQPELEELVEAVPGLDRYDRRDPGGLAKFLDWGEAYGACVVR